MLTTVLVLMACAYDALRAPAVPLIHLVRPADLRPVVRGARESGLRYRKRPSLATPPTLAQTTHDLGTLGTSGPVAARLEAPGGPYASIRSEVRVRFDAAVDRQRVTQGFQVEPDVPGPLEWPDERTLRFRPQRLAYDTTYRVRLSNLDGRTWEWSFTTIKPITLSFDDCAATEAELRTVLAVLAERRWRAIMFPTGICNARYPWLVPAMVRAGHRVCNHTYSHPRLTRLTDAQIADEIGRGVTAGCDLLRPPFGDWDGPNGRVARIAARLGYRMYLWDVETLDWAGASADQILERIQARGGVVLLHYHGRGTVEALRRLDLQPAVP